MKANFYLENGNPKVEIDGEWNSLSLFLESDSSFAEAKKHIELKKEKRWMGNTSTLQLVSGSKFEVSTELDVELATVILSQKQLLKLIDAWDKFKHEKAPCVINV